MISDILTIIWKELKEILFQRGRFRGGWLGMVFFVLVFGIFMPLQSGPDWVSSPIGLIYWAWIPFLLVSGIVADTFAGERERHTLETLLASRLSDRAILFGKLFTAILYGWGFTVLSMLISLVTVNIAHGQNGLLLYPLDIGAGILALSFLIAGLSAGLGVLVSLRASTVRQAQQTFSIAFFAIFILIFALPMLPASLQLRLVQLVSKANVTAIVAAVAAALVILDIILVGLGMIRFKRDRLILD
jgi:ABC-2 type transport system permease protein